MQLIVFATLLALAVARPSVVLTPTFYTAPVAAVNTINTPLVSQYHSQDELGQYSYGYSGGLSAKSETKAIDGVTRGAYSYLDADGKLQSVEYTADSLNGFRATASNMPVAPVETRTAPLPVTETPEVAKARADFMTAFEEAKVRAAEPEPLEEAKPLEKTIAPIAAPVAPVAAPIPLIRTTNLAANPLAFSYAYSAPTYGYYPYHFGYPYNYNFGGFRSAYPFPAATIAAPQILPQPVAETPEVASARAAHLAAHAEAKARL